MPESREKSIVLTHWQATVGFSNLNQDQGSCRIGPVQKGMGMKNLIHRINILTVVTVGVMIWPAESFSKDSNGDNYQVVVQVSLSTQSMRVYSNGHAAYEWPVSTARPGKVTPTGSWQAKWLSRHHKSSRYNNAPMPYSIFYSGNFAVHGTNQIDRLGSPASAGCIRIHPKNAAVLFALVQEVGLRNTIISVSD